MTSKSSEPATADLNAVRSTAAAARKRIAVDPLRGEGYFALCAALLRLGAPEATALLETCTTRFPVDPGWAAIAEALLDNNKPAAALVCVGRAAGLDSPDLLLRGGLAARDLGDMAGALIWFGRAVDVAPGSERAWFLLGTVAQNRGDHAGAAAAYRQVLTLNPQRSEAAFNLGTVLQDGGDLAEAKVSYARAFALNPQCFGRVVQALSAAPRGELWLDLDAGRQALASG